MLTEAFSADFFAFRVTDDVFDSHANTRKTSDPNFDGYVVRKPNHTDIATPDLGHRACDPLFFHSIITEAFFFEKKCSRLFKPTYIIGVVSDLHLICLIILDFMNISVHVFTSLLLATSVQGAVFSREIRPAFGLPLQYNSITKFRTQTERGHGHENATGTDRF